MPPRQWPVYGGDLAGTKYSELSQINRSNVGQLQPAWVFHAPEIAGRLSTIECNPLVIRDVMYLTSPSLKVFALEAATGQKIWEFVAPTGRAGVNRGFAYWEQGARETPVFFGRALPLRARPRHRTAGAELRQGRRHRYA